MKKEVPEIEIQVSTEYIDAPAEDEHYIFAYHITIKNHSNTTYRLVGRYWIITDADGISEEIKGNSVLGKQPHLKPGESFEYTSNAILNTPIGNMRGHYQLINDEGQQFSAEVPPFRLAIPNILH